MGKEDVTDRIHTPEVDAAVSQIESSMSAQQISSITSMNLTQQDLAVAIADAGAASSTSGSASITAASSVQPQGGAGAPADGGPGGGNPPTDLGGLVIHGFAVAGAVETSIGDLPLASGQSRSPPLPCRRKDPGRPS